MRIFLIPPLHHILQSKNFRLPLSKESSVTFRTQFSLRSCRDLGGQNPAEISRNLGGQNPAENLVEIPKSQSQKLAENLAEIRKTRRSIVLMRDDVEIFLVTSKRGLVVMVSREY